MSDGCFPTPRLSHLTSDDFSFIYEPAEDSFLLLDALEKDCERVRCVRPDICLEVGCGSGICITFLATMLKSSPSSYFCTDINYKAAEIATQTGKQNGVHILPLITDLVGGLDLRLKGHVDILLFNPPYVVTPEAEVGSRGLEAAWAGGESGRTVIDRFLPKVPDLMSQKGLFYLVVIKENKPEEIERVMYDKGFHMETVLSRQTGPELLSVLRFQRSQH
ncbi:methyltransferase N6AMT1-like [Ostrea edulis]|uniref:methyltransferase N6AMT1-like n=1 Tax=Ostrea edulis TaxID=37623 RepID=UPI0024AF338F|nr:methyltransferase N6AMT1-like [Ostrea edulis]XP_055995753.1 methyltransferase N6AMT1-like [Ostrea edulis]XP_055995754.1 methyltransferase N6AMT1-like [Ostrea edulis]